MADTQIAPIPRGAFVRMTIGAALISTTSIFVRWAHVAPTTSAFYRMLFGGIMLFMLLLARRQWRRPSMAEVLVLTFPALTFGVDLMMWHRSIREVGPGLATLLGNLQVFIMAGVGIVLYRERPGWRFVIGVMLALAGLWLLVGIGWDKLTPDYHLGVLLGLLTGVAYAVFMLSLRRAQLRSARLTPEWTLCLVSLLCATALGGAVAGESAGFAIPDAQSWLALLGLGLFGQVLGWVLIARAMPQLPASLVGLLLLLQPVLSFLLDVILFGRPTAASDWLGLGLSLLGIFIASSRRRAA
ncbi:MAG TPA: DMT family transporter [Rhodanobacteraceae bacterium]|jgi:drug/metabolite transporter (DMT)-like permease|nr:DMT family transporter [Rhodanobacteraceae bacterium]